MPSARRKRYLIVNADDFGQSSGINQGIIEAHECGIVTSASLMVRWPASAEAAAYGRMHAELSLGLHFDFGEWAWRDGTWIALYQVVSKDAGAVAREASRQLAAFRRLVGIDPTHLDSHQHAHQTGPVRSVLVDLAQELGVPLRAYSPHVHYCGGFYGQTPSGESLPHLISVAALTKMLGNLRPGVTELGCHPGYADALLSMYRYERAEETKTLCDPRVRAAIADRGIDLCSFRDVASATKGGGS